MHSCPRQLLSFLSLLLVFLPITTRSESAPERKTTVEVHEEKAPPSAVADTTFVGPPPGLAISPFADVFYRVGELSDGRIFFSNHMLFPGGGPPSDLTRPAQEKIRPWTAVVNTASQWHRSSSLTDSSLSGFFNGRRIDRPVAEDERNFLVEKTEIEKENTTALPTTTTTSQSLVKEEKRPQRLLLTIGLFDGPLISPSKNSSYTTTTTLPTTTTSSSSSTTTTTTVTTTTNSNKEMVEPTRPVGVVSHVSETTNKFILKPNKFKPSFKGTSFVLPPQAFVPKIPEPPLNPKKAVIDFGSFFSR